MNKMTENNLDNVTARKTIDWAKELKEWGKALILAVIIFLIISQVFASTTVYSVSMQPTLQEKDMLIMFKLGNVKNGDIVSFRSNLALTKSDVDGLTFVQKIFNKVGNRKILIKRVIAGPGDILQIKDGIVYINDDILKEDYVNSPTFKDVDRMQIPDDFYFLMGDNRSNSYDSRDLGLVDKKDILGKVILRYWPAKRFGAVK